MLASLGNVGHSAVYLATRGASRFQRVYRISNEVARGNGARTSRRMFWMRRLIDDAALIMLVGEALGRAPIFADGLAAGRAVTLPSGVDLARARRLAAAPSPHPWLGAEIPLVIGIGRLRPQKDFDLLIEAVGLARRTRRLRLVIIGGGTAAERLRLERLAAAAGFDGDFLLAGETENVFAWAARASVFALSSRWEGSSLALLEALAVGVPVVATRNAGDAADVLGEGRYGAVVEADDPHGFAAALLTQISPQAVLPGERAASYDLAALADRYAGVVAGVIAADGGEAQGRLPAIFACLSRSAGVARPEPCPLPPTSPR